MTRAAGYFHSSSASVYLPGCVRVVRELTHGSMARARAGRLYYPVIFFGDSLGAGGGEGGIQGMGGHSGTSTGLHALTFREGERERARESERERESKREREGEGEREMYTPITAQGQ